jgi:hypothetical protein
VSATSSTDAWAAGISRSRTLTLHWNGTAWSKVASPNPRSGTYFPGSMTADSPTDAWAVGTDCTTSSCDVENTLILHWNATAWSRASG